MSCSAGRDGSALLLLPLALFAVIDSAAGATLNLARSVKSGSHGRRILLLCFCADPRALRTRAFGTHLLAVALGGLYLPAPLCCEGSHMTRAGAPRPATKGTECLGAARAAAPPPQHTPKHTLTHTHTYSCRVWGVRPALPPPRAERREGSAGSDLGFASPRPRAPARTRCPSGRASSGRRYISELRARPGGTIGGNCYYLHIQFLGFRCCRKDGRARIKFSTGTSIFPRY
eukprot:SAG31_NODE_384_length_16414_cov_7.492308_15_plen_231_part_00